MAEPKCYFYSPSIEFGFIALYIALGIIPFNYKKKNTDTEVCGAGAHKNSTLDAGFANLVWSY